MCLCTENAQEASGIFMWCTKYEALKDNGNRVKVISLILTNKIVGKEVTDNKVNETVG